MIYCIFGQPGSGKTTISSSLRERLKKLYGRCMEVIVIDGDVLREIFDNQNYGAKGRISNINSANTIATFLNHLGYEVIIALVNPYDDLRKMLKKSNPKDCKFIYLHSDRLLRKEFHVSDFEVPKDPDLTLDTSNLTLNACVNKIIDL